MRPLFGVWKIIFMQSTAVWKKREKKRKKKFKNFKVAFLDFFLTAMASRLSGIATTNISRHPSQKYPKKISKLRVRRVKVSCSDPHQSEWVNHAQLTPEGFQSKNLVQIMMLEAKNSFFFAVKNPLQIQLENFSRIFCWIWMDYGYSRCPIWNFLLISDGAGYGGYPPARKVARPPL